MTTRFFKTALLTVAAVSSLAACDMISGRESPGQYATDTAISTKVKMAFTQDPVIAAKPFQINVETMQGIVQLSGFVDNADIEHRAVAAARKVDGVRDVKDSLVVPTGYKK